jgi:hypothetical protein
MARSNRPLTQFAVGKVAEYLDLGPERFQNAAAGSTSVTLNQEGDTDILGVWLFDQPIAELLFVNGKFNCVALSDGGFYDKAGNPSRTTRERQNGILDYLGDAGLIPEKVRVFLCKDLANGSQCYVGRDTDREPFGKGHADVVIGANPTNLEFYK